MDVPRDYLVIDTETTGLIPAELCEVAAVEVRGGEVVDAWTSLVRPSIKIGEIAGRIHGITDDDVRDAERVAPLIRLLDDMERVGTVVGWNVLGFDLKVMKNHYDVALRDGLIPERRVRAKGRVIDAGALYKAVRMVSRQETRETAMPKPGETELQYQERILATMAQSVRWSLESAMLKMGVALEGGEHLHRALTDAKATQKTFEIMVAEGRIVKLLGMFG